MVNFARGKIYPPVSFEHASTNYGLDEIEWERIVERMGRNPNDLESAIFAMLWSESYCNKSSAALLDTIVERLGGEVAQASEAAEDERPWSPL